MKGKSTGVESTKISTGGIYRVILKAREILVYIEVHEFPETVQNYSRKPPGEICKKVEEWFR